MRGLLWPHVLADVCYYWPLNSHPAGVAGVMLWASPAFWGGSSFAACVCLLPEVSVLQGVWARLRPSLIGLPLLLLLDLGLPRALCHQRFPCYVLQVLSRVADLTFGFPTGS